MKKNLAHTYSKILTLVAALLLAAPLAGANELAQLPEKVFAPSGFDDNDNAQVVLYGHFPDSCFQAGPASFVVNGKEIQIKNVANRNTNLNCIKAPVPWMTTVNLGSLPVGLYSVVVADQNEKWVHFENLDVAPAVTPQTDDFKYAYVNGAIVDRSTQVPVLTITGSFSLTCMQIGSVQLKETGSVIVVLPIVQIWEGNLCGYPFMPIPYAKRIQVPTKTKGPVLLHIRSMNGQALNQVIEN